MELRYLIIEDEPPAIALLEDYANNCDFLKSAGSFTDAYEAVQFLKDEPQSYDFIFLDVKMPGLSGPELLDLVAKPIPTIFVTAFDQYAVQSYDYNTIAYLTKPVAYSKFLAAVYKMRDYIGGENQKHSGVDSFFVKDGSRYLRLEFSNIQYLQGMSNYLQLVAKEKTYTLHLSLKRAGQLLPRQFLRVHQSYIVNIQQVDEIYGNTIHINGLEIPVGRQYKEDLMSRLNALM